MSEGFEIWYHPNQHNKTILFSRMMDDRVRFISYGPFPAGYV